MLLAFPDVMLQFYYLLSNARKISCCWELLKPLCQPACFTKIVSPKIWIFPNMGCESFTACTVVAICLQNPIYIAKAQQYHSRTTIVGGRVSIMVAHMSCNNSAKICRMYNYYAAFESLKLFCNTVICTPPRKIESRYRHDTSDRIATSTDTTTALYKLMPASSMSPSLCRNITMAV